MSKLSCSAGRAARRSSTSPAGDVPRNVGPPPSGFGEGGASEIVGKSVGSPTMTSEPPLAASGAEVSSGSASCADAALLDHATDRKTKAVSVETLGRKH